MARVRDRSHRLQRWLALLLFVCASSCDGRKPTPSVHSLPNVLLISIDTLRADRVGRRGSEGSLTPHLDTLAARGVRFTHASAPRAKTTPSLASVMTGLYPHEHGVRDLARPLAGRAEGGPSTLAEAFAEGGWRTAAIVGNYVLRRELAGLERGFERWIEELPDVDGVPPDDVPQRRATSLTDGALELLLGADAVPGPWFVWLHYMDPHGAYDAPPEYVRPSAPPASARDLVPDPARPAPQGVTPWIATYNVLDDERVGERIDADAVRARYDAEVRYVDAELGRLLQGLESASVDRDTWIIVFADHGESLGENHYWFEHGRSDSEATVRVPLLIVPPRGARGPVGERRGDIALADLYPTVLELVGLTPRQLVEARGPRGRSRAALVARDDVEPHAVFSEKVERADLERVAQTKSVRVGDWKLRRRYARDGERMRLVDECLFDLVTDPWEERDLAVAPPPRAPIHLLRGALLEFVAADADLVGLGDQLEKERALLERERPDVARRLRALGY